MMMKRSLVYFMSVLLLLGLTACKDLAVVTETATPESERQTSVQETSFEAEEETDALGNADVEDSDMEEPESDAVEGKTVVVYFSATGNTEKVASVIAEAADGELFKLEPVEPYTDVDLDWTDEDSRVGREHEDPEQREIQLVSTTVDDWGSASVVYIGYPLWWGIAAWPVNSFVEANDFTGKTVIPFCTSTSSGAGESGELLAKLAGSGEWKECMRFPSNVSDEEVREWVEGLGS